jgi:hypothetical protein
VQPTREWTGEQPAGRRVSPTTTLPVWPCSGWGLPQPAGHPTAGELLPRHFTLTHLRRRFVSVALSLGSPPLAVNQHPALWSSDFPRPPPVARRQPRLPVRLAPRPHLQYIIRYHRADERYDQASRGSRASTRDSFPEADWAGALARVNFRCYSASNRK